MFNEQFMGLWYSAELLNYHNGSDYINAIPINIIKQFIGFGVNKYDFKDYYATPHVVKMINPDKKKQRKFVFYNVISVMENAYEYEIYNLDDEFNNSYPMHLHRISPCIKVIKSHDVELPVPIYYYNVNGNIFVSTTENLNVVKILPTVLEELYYER